MFEETGRKRAENRSRRARKGSPPEKAAAPRKNNRSSQRTLPASGRGTVPYTSGRETPPARRRNARRNLAARRDSSIQRAPSRRESPYSPETPSRRGRRPSRRREQPYARKPRGTSRRRRASRRWQWPFRLQWPARRRNAARRRRRYNSARARLTRRIALGAFTAVLLLFCAVWSANHLLFQKPEIPKAEPTAAYLPPIVFPPAEEEEGSPPLPAASAPGTAAHQKRKKDFYTILIAGADQNNGGSDTIILAGFDAVNDRLYGLSIPRDTKTTAAGSIRKINAAYRIGGMPLLSSTVSSHLGLPIDYTVEVDLEGFAALVDAIGGVEFDVPLDMDYDDEMQDLYIHVPKGLQLLDGETALKVVRFRHNNDGTGYGNEDLGRIATQQNFLRAVAKKLLSPQSLFKLDECAKIFRQYVNTELTVRNLMWFGREALAIGVEGIDFSTLPGSWKYPYIYTDKEAALAVINAHLNPYEEDRRMEDLRIPS